METTFMTIHNLTPEANIMYASDSIFEILGYCPEDVTGKSCFDYFHPEEIPFARGVHNRGVMMDKAAVLNYARIKNREGQWVSCECVFTVVYEVLVACTSIYRRDEAHERRAVVAPTVRKLFASSPRDPRYHMLEHLSSKFRTPPQASLLEPRAALILNRFTRTLTVMYATNAVANILGVTPEQFKNKSFYECMQENCLPEAIRCLESAKANDSIAYLRFWYRDPRRPEDHEDEEMREVSQSSDSEDGGVELSDGMDLDTRPAGSSNSLNSEGPSLIPGRTSSAESTDLGRNASNAIFDQPQASQSSAASSVDANSRRGNQGRRQVSEPQPMEPVEIEAVVSCTSDGLVVVLRRARAPIPNLQQPVQAAPLPNGVFAAPWGVNPIRPHQYQPDPLYPFQHGLQAPQAPVGGPPLDEVMRSIQDCAAFAWSLTGINGNIATYGHGTPRGEALPPGGFLPVWDPHGQTTATGYCPPENQAWLKWQRMGESAYDHAGNDKRTYNYSRQENLVMQQYGSNMGSTGPNQVASMHQTLHRFELTPTYHQPQILQSHAADYPPNQGQAGSAVEPGFGNRVGASLTNHRGSQNPDEDSEGPRGNRYGH